MWRSAFLVVCATGVLGNCAAQEQRPEFATPEQARSALQALQAAGTSEQLRAVATEVNQELYLVEYDRKLQARMKLGPKIVYLPFRGSHVVVDGPIEVREAPDADSMSLGILDNGEGLLIIGTLDEWYLIESLVSGRGYVRKDVSKGKIRGIVLSKGVENAVDDFSLTVEEERAEYTSGAFRCRSELEMCRAEFDWLDCELTMIVCLVDVVLN